VFVLVEMARAGSVRQNAPGPFTFHAAVINSRMSPRQGECPGANSRQPHQFSRCTFLSHFRAFRFSNKPRTSSCSRVSKTQLAWGSTRAACPFSMGSWQTRNALALQASSYEGGTHRLHHFTAGNSRFFVPEPSLVVNEKTCSPLTNPSVAGVAKPHMVDQLIRSGSNLPTCWKAKGTMNALTEADVRLFVSPRGWIVPEGRGVNCMLPVDWKALRLVVGFRICIREAAHRSALRS